MNFGKHQFPSFKSIESGQKFRFQPEGAVMTKLGMLSYCNSLTGKEFTVGNMAQRVWLVATTYASKAVGGFVKAWRHRR
jgi:hypothetical protein